MSRTIELTRVIRGQVVTFFATSFDGDPSVGLEIVPEEVWAVDERGEPFELTDKETESLIIAVKKIRFARFNGHDVL